MADDVRRHELAVLIAAIIRLAFDVQHDPSRLRIAVSRAVVLHRFRIGLEVARRRPTGYREWAGHETERQPRQRGKMIGAHHDSHLSKRQRGYGFESHGANILFLRILTHDVAVRKEIPVAMSGESR